MRGKWILTALLVTALVGTTSLGMAGEKVYGKGVSDADTTLVSHLLAHPDDYVGKTVRVEGTAVAVCTHRGCWVELASDQEGETVRIKVKDGVIIFPVEIIGEHVIAEGVFTANQLDLETSKKYCAHKANEEGKELDPESVTECVTLYQITGTGAEVMELPVKEASAAGDA